MPYFPPVSSGGASFVATQGVWMPKPFFGGPAFVAVTMDATGEKAAWIGRVWNKDRTTKSIRKVGFCWGATVTKVGGSAMTLSLQNVITSGSILAPDGTQDQTVALSNAQIGAGNTWEQTDALSADRSVAFGELLAVVIEYDGAGRLGSDSIMVQAALSHGVSPTGARMMQFTTGAWTTTNGGPGVILEFTDGTFGTLDGGLPALAINNTAYNSGSNPDERALKFRVPFSCKIDGLWAIITATATADFDLVLYDDTTPLVTVSTEGDQQTSPGTAGVHFMPIAETELQPNTDYYISLKPTTANNANVYDYTVNDVNHLQAHDGGLDFHYAQRVDAGAWTPTTTRRPCMGFRISAVKT